MGCWSPTQRLPWEPGRRTGRAFHQRVKNPRVASNSHLKDHGIASSGKKRPQSNDAHGRVKEILVCVNLRAVACAVSAHVQASIDESPVRTSAFTKAPADETDAKVVCGLTNPVAGGLCF